MVTLDVCKNSTWDSLLIHTLSLAPLSHRQSRLLLLPLITSSTHSRICATARLTEDFKVQSLASILELLSNVVYSSPFLADGA